MKDLKLNAYKIEEIQFVNKVKGNTKIELKNSYAYNVRYTNNNICEGKFTVNIADKENPEAFSVKLVLAGIFLSFYPVLSNKGYGLWVLNGIWQRDAFL